jgi:hypothetical protein
MSTNGPDGRAAEVLHRLVYGSVDWPGKTLRLDADSLDRYQQRPLSRAVSIGELYHENSKLIPERASEWLCDGLDARSFKLSVVHAMSEVAAAAAPIPPVPLPEHLAAVLARYPAALPEEVRYAVDVRPLVGNRVTVHEPGADGCRALRVLSRSELEALEAGVYAGRSGGGAGHATLVFVVGMFARNAILYGERGYRSTLLESGATLHAIAAGAAELNMPAHVITEFDDHRVDSILDLDGIEAGTLAVVSLGRPADA